MGGKTIKTKEIGDYLIQLDENKGFASFSEKYIIYAIFNDQIIQKDTEDTLEYALKMFNHFCNLAEEELEIKKQEKKRSK